MELPFLVYRPHFLSSEAATTTTAVECELIRREWNTQKEEEDIVCVCVGVTVRDYTNGRTSRVT